MASDEIGNTTKLPTSKVSDNKSKRETEVAGPGRKSKHPSLRLLWRNINLCEVKSIQPAHYSEIMAWHSHAWLLPAANRLIITAMKSSPWQRRIQRAEHLASKYSFASRSSVLHINIARFQENLYGRLETESEKATGSHQYPSGPPELKTLIGSFSPFLPGHWSKSMLPQL